MKTLQSSEIGWTIIFNNMSRANTLAYSAQKAATNKNILIRMTLGVKVIKNYFLGHLSFFQDSLIFMGQTHKVLKSDEL